jgi:regulator of replication initiation timing
MTIVEQIKSKTNQLHQLNSQIFNLTSQFENLKKQIEDLQEQKYDCKYDLAELKELELKNPKFSWDWFPKEIQEKIFEFSDPNEKLRLSFSGKVLPFVQTEVFLRRLNKIKKKFNIFQNFDFIHSNVENDPFYSGIDVIYQKKRILVVSIDRDHIVWGEKDIFLWLGTGGTINDLMDFLVRHYVHGIPIPPYYMYF